MTEKTLARAAYEMLRAAQAEALAARAAKDWATKDWAEKEKAWTEALATYRKTLALAEEEEP